MSKVKIEGNASGTGTFTIAAPNSNTDRTLTLPDEAGTVLTSASDISSQASEQIPLFSAYHNSSQTMTINTHTKVQMGVENADSDGWYDTSTYRFTPQIGGWYFISGVVRTSARNRNLTSIYKNGTAWTYGNDVNDAGGGNNSSTISTLVYLNGSTDYVELYLYTSSTGQLDNGNATQWSGFLVRAA
jgi:hypothetical protein